MALALVELRASPVRGLCGVQEKEWDGSLS